MICHVLPPTADDDCATFVVSWCVLTFDLVCVATVIGQMLLVAHIDV